MACVQASIEALADNGRALAALASHHQALRQDMEGVYQQLREDMGVLYREAQELKDIRNHWAQWRVGFEDRRDASEIHMLRTISELQGAFQHRVTLLEQSFRELARQQHASFTDALERNTMDVQKRLWRDLEKIRGEYEKLIHHELKLIRQKAAAVPVGSGGGTGSAQAAGRYRLVRDSPMIFAAPRSGFASIRRCTSRSSQAPAEILDVGCGRGEFLEAAREAGVAARGIDQSEESRRRVPVEGFARGARGIVRISG